MALILTTLGELDESLLDKKEGTFEDDNEITKWVEYWKEGEMIHRSVHVHLKKGLLSGFDAAGF